MRTADRVSWKQSWTSILTLVRQHMSHRADVKIIKQYRAKKLAMGSAIAWGCEIGGTPELRQVMHGAWGTFDSSCTPLHQAIHVGKYI